VVVVVVVVTLELSWPVLAELFVDLVFVVMNEIYLGVEQRERKGLIEDQLLQS